MDVVDFAKYMYKRLEEREKVSQMLLLTVLLRIGNSTNPWWVRYGASLSQGKKSKPCWRKTQTMSKTLYLPEHLAQKINKERQGC
jgi:hypothetical protein